MIINSVRFFVFLSLTSCLYAVHAHEDDQREKVEHAFILTDKKQSVVSADKSPSIWQRHAKKIYVLISGITIAGVIRYYLNMAGNNVGAVVPLPPDPWPRPVADHDHRSPRRDPPPAPSSSQHRSTEMKALKPQNVYTEPLLLGDLSVPTYTRLSLFAPLKGSFEPLEVKDEKQSFSKNAYHGLLTAVDDIERLGRPVEIMRADAWIVLPWGNIQTYEKLVEAKNALQKHLKTLQLWIKSVEIPGLFSTCFSEDQEKIVYLLKSVRLEIKRRNDIRAPILLRLNELKQDKKRAEDDYKAVFQANGGNNRGWMQSASQAEETAQKTLNDIEMSMETIQNKLNSLFELSSDPAFVREFKK